MSTAQPNHPKFQVDFTGAVWTKQNGSWQENCVEHTRVGDTIGLRDSRDPEGPILRFTPAEMRAFLGGVETGETDYLTA